MKTLLLLSWKSLRNRRASVALSMVSIMISIVLFTSVLYLRDSGRQWFMQTVSGTDLVVGARSGPVNLLLYSVFRIGNATNNIAWRSYREMAADPAVDWTIPLSLGDSHRGYRVLGTNQDYFVFYRYGERQPLAFAAGRPFGELYDAVLGAEVAARLGYRLGERIVLAHGAGKVSFVQHRDKPFTVVGILKPTGTPVDRAVHVGLDAIDAIHSGLHGGASSPSHDHHPEHDHDHDHHSHEHDSRAITAFMVGLKSKAATFQLQRAINDYPREPLLAIMPGAALAELWQVLAVVENLLKLIAAFVVAAGLAGLLITLLATLNERRGEMAVLRSVGAGPRQIFFLFVFEAFWIVAAACIGALLLLYGLLWLGRPFLLEATGITVPLAWPAGEQWLLLAGVVALGSLLGLIPGALAYRRALTDGLSVRP